MYLCRVPLFFSHVSSSSLQSKTFPVTFNSRSAGLTLEWTQGFTLSYEGIGEIAWRYKFSQLRGSSDDGKSRLKLHFQEPDSIAIETKVNTSFATERFIATQWFKLFFSQEKIKYNFLIGCLKFLKNTLKSSVAFDPLTFCYSYTHLEM